LLPVSIQPDGADALLLAIETGLRPSETDDRKQAVSEGRD
jgi:hypothetical protein